MLQWNCSLQLFRAYVTYTRGCGKWHYCGWQQVNLQGEGGIMYKGKKAIGVCTAELDEKYRTKLLGYVLKELIKRGDYVFVFGTDSDMFLMNDSDYGDASIFELINYDLLDGIVLFSDTVKQGSFIDDIVHQANGHEVPVVSVGKEIGGCYNVVYDSEAAFEVIVRHVVEYHEAREVNFISGPQGNEIADRRLEIYKRVLDENGIPFEECRVGYGDFWVDPTVEVMDEFMEPTRVPPEAIICANDSMAVAVCDYLNERDICVPDEIMVTGIDGIDEGVRHFPGITTCARDEINDSKKIADVIQHVCTGKPADRLTILEYHLRLSQSCGCQRNHLFDCSRLIMGLNWDMASYHSNIRYYAKMSEAFLNCKDDNAFKKILFEYMPEGSFICINSDLGIGKKMPKNHFYRDNAFTSKMKSFTKLNGNITVEDCPVKNIIPEAGMEVSDDMPVVLLPLHFGENVTGYMGLWIDMGHKMDMNNIIYFLRSFDNSAGYRMAYF